MECLNSTGKAYDWDNWLNGDVWLIEKDADFTCDPNSFRSQVDIAARARGLRVRTKKVPEGMQIQAHGSR